MRYIRTENNYVEFIEADGNDKILSSRGFQFGELYFQIKNGKVTFYLNDQENPWRNDVWTINLPITIDGEVYDNEDDASAALHNIMNDRFQEQLDELNEGLAAETARAEQAEEDLGEEIDDERDRATSAETHLQTEVTELSGLVSTFDERITRVEDDMSAFTDNLTNEIARSTAKDAEHDAEISGLTDALATETAARIAGDSALTDALNSEIQRALSAETSLHNEILDERNRAITVESGLTDSINGEIQRATSAETALHDEILDERNRALAAESALTNDLNDEIARSTSKDASQDALISGLTTSLQNEINRAVGAENSLRNDLNAEISARTANDADELQRIASLETGKADVNSVYTKTESDNKYATKDYLSGLTENIYTKGEVNTLLNDKADKVSAVSSAMYNSQSKTIDFKNISGTVISSVDARDFIKDGMVDNVAISGSNLVITFNTDAGKEPISIPLTNIFDPSNYYNKAEIDAALSGKASTGDVQTISGQIQTISGDVQTLSGEIQTISGEAITSGEVQTMIDQSVSGKLDTESGVTDIRILTHSQGNSLQIEQRKANAWQYVNTIYKVGSGLTWDYSTKKIDVDFDAVALKSDVETISGDVQTISGVVQTISGESLSSGDVQTMIDQSISGKVNVVDNQVDNYGTIETTASTNNQSYSADSYANGAKYFYHKAYETNYCTGGKPKITGSITVIDSNDNVVYDYTIPDNTYLNQLLLNSQYVHVIKEMDDDSYIEVTPIGNYRIKYISFYMSCSWRTETYITYYQTNPKYPSYQSAEAIENNIYPKLDSLETAVNSKQSALSAGTGIDITNNVISVTGGTEGITSAQCQTLIDNSISGKQDTLSAGTNIQINNNVISATDTKYTAGNGIDITNNVISATGGSGVEYSAGTNVQINNHVISATDTTYTAGDGISISNNNVISTVTKFSCVSESEWSSISGNPQSNTVYLIY